MSEPGRAERLAEWVDARLRGVDAELAERVRSAVRTAAPDATVLDAPRALTAAAAERLEPLAAEGCSARASAIELLAVDTLVTLACESLSDACGSTTEIEERATAMIRAIAATMPELDGAA